jgi:hypothetical protein
MNRPDFKIIFLLLFIIFGCSIFCPLSAQNNTGKVNLSYNYPDMPVKYLSTTEVIQVMDINGEKMETNVFEILGCTVHSKGKDGNDLVLDIKIDTLKRTIDSQGDLQGGPVMEAMGKVFLMKVSFSGKETDFSGAEQIVYRDATGSLSNASELFADFFPNIPSGEMAPGHTWPATDSIASKSPSTTMIMTVNSANRYEGLDPIRGINCARISSQLSGTMEFTTVDQNTGMKIRLKGPFTGTAELWFAQEKGYFIKNSTNTSMSGTIQIISPDIISFPVTWKSASVKEVVD